MVTSAMDMLIYSLKLIILAFRVPIIPRLPGCFKIKEKPRQKSVSARTSVGLLKNLRGNPFIFHFYDLPRKTHQISLTTRLGEALFEKGCGFLELLFLKGKLLLKTSKRRTPSICSAVLVLNQNNNRRVMELSGKFKLLENEFLPLFCKQILYPPCNRNQVVIL
jgi:hypothetical protein